jgi:paraquat-inducible protein B
MAGSTTNHWKLGLFIVTSVAAAVAASIWLGASRLQREFHTVYSYFDEPVDGLEVGSPVKFRGVPIGNVTAIKAAPDQHHVEVEAKIYLDSLERLGLRDPAHPRNPSSQELIPPKLRTQLVGSLVTGIAFIQTDFFDPERHPLPKYPFDPAVPTVHSVPSSSKRLETGLVETLDAIPDLARTGTSLLRTLEQTLVDADLDGLSTRARRVLELAERKLAELDTTRLGREVADASTELRAAMQAARQFVTELRAADGPIRTIAARIDTLLATVERSVGDADLPAVANALRAAAGDTGELVRDAGGALPGVRRMAEAVARLAELLERDPGALLHGKSPPNRGGAR